MSTTSPEETTRRVIAIVVGVCVLFLIGVMGVLLHQATEAEVQVKVACVQGGGVWSDGLCTWSKR
jgi:hypothetical protein